MIKSFVERFNIFFNDVSLMFSEKRVIKQPYRLFLDYLRFRYKMRFGKNVQCEKIFGFNITFPNYTHFFSLWKEIFLREIYVLHNTENKPSSILDVGSNFGLSSLFFKLLYQDVAITAFEPNPLTFDRLKQNIEGNKLHNVTLLNVAVDGSAGTVRLFVDPADQDGVTDSIIESRGQARSHTKVVDVQAVILSQYLTNEVDLVKMDIEGAEYSVMREIEPHLHKIKKISAYALDWP